VGRERTGQAEARTKKIAAQRAARVLYERLLVESAPGTVPETPGGDEGGGQ